jgi:hypothetical protein
MNTQRYTRTALENLEKRVLLSASEVTDFGARPNDGQDDRGAIQAAINAAHDGDTVFFADGAYNVGGQITLKSGINITAEHELRAELNFSVPVNGGDINGDNYAFRGIGLHDFSFTNLKVRSNNGIFFLQDTNNTRFTDNDFVWGYGGNYYNRLGFYASNNNGRMRIEENYFHDSPDSDRNVELWGLSDSSYSYNRFHNVRDGGHIMEPNNNVQISFNRGTKIHRMGIEIQGHNRTTGLVVEGNTLTDWDRPWNDTFGLSVMMMNSPDTKIINNYLSADFSGEWGVSQPGVGGPRFGLAIEAGLSGGEVSGNVIGGPNPWACGVACAMSNTMVKNNKFFGHPLWGTMMGEPGNSGMGSFIDGGNEHLSRDAMPVARKIKAGPTSMTGQSNSVFAVKDNGKSTNPNANKPKPGNGNGNGNGASKPIVWEEPVDADIDDTGEVYLSDLTWTSADNGWGDVEKDASNGERRAGDGTAITLNAKKYKKGLGVAVNSEVVYDLDAKYAQFFSDIGIDDEVRSKGSMTFQVWADGRKIFQSGVKRGDDATDSIKLDVSGVRKLKLVTTQGDNGDNSDHGDWAAARLLPAATTSEQPVEPSPSDASA